ncbi:MULTISPECIES: DUF6673 family protein [Erysipelotrichales]|uniref:DUF6673 family protein n=1 Tax=Erysipelotrichales TaxID=526525 RepID=UPI000B44DB0E|nr:MULTISPECIES: DUF6673 family protein [Erysipelotrichales]OUN38287.1 hypothetical protein B5G32_01165 [Massilimicrobiota sp. An80]
MSQEKNTIWSINGLELEMDLDDAEILEKYEEAFTEMDVQEKEFPKDGKTSEIVRRYCDLYYRLFENLFGKDNADKIVQKKYHMGQWEEVYASFLKFASLQMNAINTRRNAIIQPTKNRAARRSKQKAMK